MIKEPKELYNGFLFLRTGDKVDSPLVAYTLNLESVNIDCLEEEFEEKIEALKNGKNVTIKLVCNKAEVVSPDRIIEYAYEKDKADRINAYTVDEMIKDLELVIGYCEEKSESDLPIFRNFRRNAGMYRTFIEYAKILKGVWERKNGRTD